MSPGLNIRSSFDAHINDPMMAFAVSAIVFILLTLGAYAWTAWNPVSRPHLNRVSFRLLVYALVANLMNASMMISGTRVTAGAGCNLKAFFANACLMFAGVMFFSMALNLQLVLVHGVNGQKLERCYVLGGLLMAAACNIPPYAAGALGLYHASCWFNSPDPAIQLRWFIGTQAFWLFLMSMCEVVSFFTIVGYMVFRHRTSSGLSTTVTSTVSMALPIPKPPIVLYHGIILRIGLYPLFSCFFNVTTCALGLYQIRNQVLTEVNLRLDIVDLLVYAIRPMMYALLAATDPSFLRALRTLRRPTSKMSFNNPDSAHERVGNTANTWPLTSATTTTDCSPQLCDREAGTASTLEGKIASEASVPDFACQI
ncbi:hypothetical protein DFH07DRAFT_1034124 [Mycena maculata]|uniref:Uncharacterized protein n=1 Tax=Mycena maculata TaxID=230809 RepID=A0AAD7N9B5_9AGAR|nr:hypothetical protein DFH07DRAFT_1034124 [Mycena maculata]